jgi:hypothetical protein
MIAFGITLTVAILAASLAAEAQLAEKVYRIGVLSSGSVASGKESGTGGGISTRVARTRLRGGTEH